EVEYAAGVKEKLATARRQGLDAVRAVENELGKIDNCEAGILIDLFLSYRAVKGYQEMVDLQQRMSPPLRSTVMVREQTALALNRLGKSEEAETILQTLMRERGPSSETCG